MKHNVPSMMKAVIQDEANGKLRLAEVPVPEPKKGEVLVKMEVAPFNPSDLSFLRGTYTTQAKYPVIPGIEGSGTVVASGGGFMANLRLGKRVTCSASDQRGGTWAEYMVTSAMRVLPLRKTLSFEQGCMLIVNPMTVLAFIAIAKEEKHKALVNNAAASVLGQMMVKICAKEGIHLINIVRRKEQVELLNSIGAKYVLNSSDADFENKLKDLSHQLKISLVLDAIGGEQTETLIRNTPKGTKILIYSSLSSENISISARLLIQHETKIESFYLGMWAAKRNILQTLGAASKAQKLAADTLSSNIRARYPMDQAQEALEFYVNNMTGGKVILNLQEKT